MHLATLSGPRTGLSALRDHLSVTARAVARVRAARIRRHRRPPAAIGPLFDQHQFDDVRSGIGCKAMAELLALFARELAARPVAIRAGLANNDFAGAAYQAHNLKGASLSIGARAVGEAAGALEVIFGSGAGGQRLQRALRRLDQAVAATLAALPGLLPNRPAADG